MIILSEEMNRFADNVSRKAEERAPGQVGKVISRSNDDNNYRVIVGSDGQIRRGPSF